MSVGFQQVKLGERGGRRRDFNDTGVNTRQFIEHVKESKSGLLKWKLFAHYTMYVIILVLMFSVCFVFSPGSSGSVIPLIANFFRIVSRPQWVLYQYHVDYQPAIESRRLRTALLFQHEVLGIARTFDGALLFLPHRLPDKVIWLQFYCLWCVHVFALFVCQNVLQFINCNLGDCAAQWDPQWREDSDNSHPNKWAAAIISNVHSALQHHI